mgnify:CR=1 FL=1
MNKSNPTTHAFDGTPTPMYRYLPCGSRATFDESSALSYRCDQCGATVGSVAQPQHCKNEAEKYRIMKILGGKVRWDYETGEEKIV